jgi:hypothetical protein
MPATCLGQVIGRKFELLLDCSPPAGYAKVEAAFPARSRAADTSPPLFMTVPSPVINSDTVSLAAAGSDGVTRLLIACSVKASPSPLSDCVNG